MSQHSSGPFLIADAPTSSLDDLPEHTVHYQASKEDARRLPFDIKQALPGAIAHWNVLNREQAVGLQSGPGIQFFAKEAGRYNKVPRPRVGNGDWLCLVTDTWLASHSRLPSSLVVGHSSGVEALTAEDTDPSTDAELAARQAYDSSAFEQRHRLVLQLHNHNDTPMMDGRYEVDIEGQLFRGKLNNEGHAELEHLPSGLANVTFLADNKNADTLRQNLQQALNGMVSEALDRKRMLDDLLFEDGFISGFLIIGCIWTKSMYDRGVDLSKDVVNLVKGVPSATLQLKSALYQAMQDEDEDGIIDGLNKLANAGEALAASSAELYATIQLCMADKALWAMLLEFPKRYWESSPAEDHARFFGAASFDLVLGIITGALIARVSASAVTLGSTTGVAAGLAGSRFFQPAAAALSRFIALRKLEAKPIQASQRLRQHEHTVNAKQGVDSGTPNAPAPRQETRPAQTDTEQSTGCNGVTHTCGEPISMVTGEELLELVDFELPGPLPLRWKRVYRSTAINTRSALGHGWSHPWQWSLRVAGNDVVVRNHEGLTVRFLLPANGELVRHATGVQLMRYDDAFTLIHEGQYYSFEPDANAPEQLRLARISNPDGSHAWQLCYRENENGARLSHAINSWGGTVRWHWGEHGLTRIAWQGSAEATPKTLVRYRVNSEGDLIAAKPMGQAPEQYRYRHHLFALRLASSGLKFEFDWNAEHAAARCVRQRSADGHYDYRFAWDITPSNVVDDRVVVWNQATDSNGHTETFGYSANALLLCYVRGDGSVERYTYNEAEQVTEHTNGEGQTAYFRYDGQQRLVESINVAGQRTRIDYWQRSDLPERITNHLQQTLQFTYDDQARLVAKRFADGKAEHYHYQGLQLVRKVDPFGRIHRFEWHPQWGTLSRYRCLQNADSQQALTDITWQHDEQGRVISETDQHGNSQHFVYNERGQLITRSDAHGHAEHFCYDPRGRVTAVTDKAGRRTEYHYGAYAQLQALTQPDGSRIEYHYDRERNLVGITNANGATHRFEYDACERLAKETTVDGRSIAYQYNRVGQLIGLQDGSITAQFTRNALGQLLEEHFTDPNRPNATVSNRFSYDPAGRLLEAGNDYAETEFEYHDQQLARESNALYYPNEVGQLDAHRHDVYYRYSELGQLERIRHQAYRPELSTTQYGFMHRGTYRMLRAQWLEHYQWHADGQLASLDVQTQHGQHRLLAQQFNPQGQLTEQQQGQHRLQFGYDAEQRLASIQRFNQHNATVQQRHYQYDDAWRLNVIDDLKQGRWQFHYNALDQVEQVQLPNGEQQQLRFDPAGNALPNSQEPLHALLDNRLPFWGDRHYSYDAWGNLTTIKRGQQQALVQQLHYNAKHQLIELVEHHHGQFKQRLTFAYDAFGRRVRKAVYLSEHTEYPDTTEHSIWRGQQLVHTRTERNKLNGHHPKTQITEQGVVYLPGSHVPIGVIDSQCGVVNLDTDHLGTPKTAYDNLTGEALWQAEHHLYGAIKNLQHPNNNDTKLTLNLRFQGQYEDVETGLHYNLHRYYDPHAGRYINHDPIGLMGGLNAYQYCPNPVQWVDPLGLACKEGDATATSTSTNGVPLTAEKIKEIQAIPKGERPDPKEYLPQAYINAHLQLFESQGGAFIAVESWTVSSRYPGLPPRKFVGLKSEMDEIVKRYQDSGDWRVLRDELNLGQDVDLSNDRVMYVSIDPGDSRFTYEVPNGNEAGAIPGEWVPGGKTKSGTTEAALVGSEKINHNQSFDGYQREFNNTKIIKDK